MNNALFEPAPGFDQPLAMLKHCHDKIRKQIQTLQKLLAYLPEHGASLTAQQAATAILHYFNKAAHFHHQDEEQDLIPMLQACAQGADAAQLAVAIPQLLQEHRQMDAAWEQLALQLTAIAAGDAETLSAEQVSGFATLYAGHMACEEGLIAPMAQRLFSAEQIAHLGAQMQRRRNPPPQPIAMSQLADLRQEYLRAELSESELLADPITQFTLWFEQAQKAQVREPNAMSVATASSDGRPSARILLLKGVDPQGFRFFTNYASRKGGELSQNQYCALLFFWSELERQVRVEGRVILLSDEENDAYFHSRPLASRHGALASQQSQPLEKRALLEERLAEIEQQYGDKPPRPPHWGGYCLIPDRIEFWQGRRSRLHDRIEYRLQANGEWLRQRLQP